MQGMKWMDVIWLILPLTVCCVTTDTEQISLVPILAAHHGIDFINHLEESDSFNITDYIYYYNGAGVGSADFNQDGMLDLFFTANEGPCQIYLNEGDFKFKNITLESGIVTTNWVTGVSIADINGDGWPDIYLCAAGSDDPQNRQNMLYIHQGINEEGVPTFVEAASAWGIADTAHSTQAAFFDYDGDGFLDLYVMNHGNERSIVNTPLPQKSSIGHSNDRLYKNNGFGKFEDVTYSAGIIGEGYGLGLAIVDFNRDGKPDIFVANDFIFSDQLWINQGDGTFSEQAQVYLDYQAYNSMGCDWVDMDGDGWEDLIVLDMLPPSLKSRKQMAGEISWYKWRLMMQQGYAPQFMRNMLYRNNGITPSQGGYSYQEIARYAGVDATDWSWAPLCMDLDNDGLLDLYVTNGYYRDITDQDFTDYNTNLTFFSDERSSDSLLMTAIKKQHGRHVVNGLYKQTRDWKFLPIHQGLHQYPSYSNGAVYADLNNDGLLDIVVSNINEPISLFKNSTQQTGHSFQIELVGNGHNLNAIGAKVSVYVQGTAKSKYVQPIRGYLSSVPTQLHFGLGKVGVIDSVVVIWPDQMRSVRYDTPIDTFMRINYEDESVQVYAHPGSVYPTLFSRIYPTEMSLDIAHVNIPLELVDEPLIPDGYRSRGPLLRVLEGTNNNSWVYISNSTSVGNWVVNWSSNLGWQFELFPTIDGEIQDVFQFDIDQDGRIDIVPIFQYNFHDKSQSDTNSLWFWRQLTDGGWEVRSIVMGTLPTVGFRRSTLLKTNQDTVLLLLGGIVEGRYPETHPHRLLKFEKGVWADISTQLPVEIEKCTGIIQQAEFVFLKENYYLTLMGHWMKPLHFVWTGGRIAPTGFLNALQSGWWNNSASWIDESGDLVFFLGNHGTNSTYVPTSQQPLSVFRGDFDRNGTMESILAIKIKDNFYPIHKRNVFISKMHALDMKYPKHKLFVDASYRQILEITGASQSGDWYAEDFHHRLVKVNAKGQLQELTLPEWLQSGSVNKVHYLEGEQAILLFGNDYSKSLELGYQSGWNIKVLSLHDKQVLEDNYTGLGVKGTIKEALYLIKAKQSFLWMASSEDGLSGFTKPVSSHWRPPQ